MYKFLGGLQHCIEQGLQQLYNREAGITSFDDVEVRIWKKSWPDTTIGFGGVGGQAFTTAYTVVVLDCHWNECVVFHGMRYAYKTKITKEVAERIQSQRLMGSADFAQQKEGKT